MPRDFHHGLLAHQVSAEVASEEIESHARTALFGGQPEGPMSPDVAAGGGSLSTQGVLPRRANAFRAHTAQRSRLKS